MRGIYNSRPRERGWQSRPSFFTQFGGWIGRRPPTLLQLQAAEKNSFPSCLVDAAGGHGRAGAGKRSGPRAETAHLWDANARWRCCRPPRRGWRRQDAVGTPGPLPHDWGGPDPDRGGLVSRGGRPARRAVAGVCWRSRRRRNTSPASTRPTWPSRKSWPDSPGAWFSVRSGGKTEKVAASALFPLDFRNRPVYNSKLQCTYAEEIPSAHLFPSVTPRAGVQRRIPRGCGPRPRFRIRDRRLRHHGKSWQRVCATRVGPSLLHPRRRVGRGAARCNTAIPWDSLTSLPT
jgi:hypothetical protein